MLEFLQTKQSHANFSTSAMETRNHLKNGVSPENQKSRRNFLICGIVLSALFFAFTTTSVFSQAPPNDLCINAHQLDCNGYHDGTTVGATCKGAPVNQEASCYGVWYKFEGDGNQTKITTSSTGFYHRIRRS